MSTLGRRARVLGSLVGRPVAEGPAIASSSAGAVTGSDVVAVLTHGKQECPSYRQHPDICLPTTTIKTWETSESCEAPQSRMKQQEGIEGTKSKRLPESTDEENTHEEVKQGH